jgi:hypothetical protein
MQPDGIPGKEDMLTQPTKVVNESRTTAHAGHTVNARGTQQLLERIAE